MRRVCFLHFNNKNDNAEKVLVAVQNEENGRLKGQHSVVPETNPVKRIVDEILALMGAIHDHTERLIACGLPRKTINMLVECDAQGKIDEQRSQYAIAIGMLERIDGSKPVNEEYIRKQLEALSKLQKDLGHVRKIGKQQGLDMTSINYLTMIIRQFPTDRGASLISNLHEYASECDLPTNRVKSLFEEIMAGPKSVLPDIPREDIFQVEAAKRKRILFDITIGCVFAIVALTLLT